MLWGQKTGLFRLCFIGTVLLAVMLPAGAFAQANFDPSRIPDQFKVQPLKEAPPAMPVPPVPKPAAIDKTVPRFTLQQVRLTGLTALDDTAVAAVIDPYIGRDVSLDDMQFLSGQLTQLYRDKGFVLSQVVIPPQRVDGGVIEFAALEGSISRIAFTGDEDMWLQASALALTAEKPLKIGTLQRWLLLANDAPGITVTGNLTADPEVPLGSLLTVDIKREKASFIAGLDNRGSRFIGPWQAYSGAQLNGLFLRGDMVALRGYTSHPDGQLKYIQVQQNMPLGTDGMRLETTLDVVRSKPGDSLDVLEAEGKTDTLRVAVSYPVIRSLVQNLVLGIAAEISNSRTSILDEPNISPSVDDRTRTVSVFGGYEWQHADSSVSNLQVTATRGFDVLNSSAGNTVNPSRTGATAEFWRSVVEFDHRRSMSFIKSGAGLLLSAMAQTSFGDSLLASEQMAAGGNSFGRGFDPASISGDQGVAAKAEISVPFNFGLDIYMDKTEFYGFVDAAYVEDINTGTGIEPHRQLLSSGLGFRVSPTENTTAFVEGAKQLPVSLLSGGDRPDGYRITMGVIARF